jgi:hypothetical protein
MLDDTLAVRATEFGCGGAGNREGARPLLGSVLVAGNVVHEIIA